MAGFTHCSRIYLTGCNINIDFSSICNNNATYEGAGICLYFSGIETIKNSNISNNTGYLGGGISFYCSDEYDPNRLFLENVVINNNHAYYGGGIYCGYSNTILVNVTIKGNTASSTNGGIALWYSDIIMNNSILWAN